MALHRGPMKATCAHKRWIFGGVLLSADHVREVAAQTATGAGRSWDAGSSVKSRWSARWSAATAFAVMFMLRRVARLGSKRRPGGQTRPSSAAMNRARAGRFTKTLGEVDLGLFLERKNKTALICGHLDLDWVARKTNENSLPEIQWVGKPKGGKFVHVMKLSRAVITRASGFLLHISQTVSSVCNHLSYRCAVYPASNPNLRTLYAVQDIELASLRQAHRRGLLGECRDCNRHGGCRHE